MFKKYQKKLLERGKPSDYPETVATTWELSFEKLQEESHAAVEIMNLCAFLAPDDIPLNIIRDGAEHFPETLKMVVKDPLELDDTIVALTKYSLIKTILWAY